VGAGAGGSIASATSCGPASSSASSCTYCCRTRAPPRPISVKRIAEALSVAEYSFTGIVTRPKPSDSEAIARADRLTPMTRPA